MTVKLTYVGEPERVYPGLGLEPVPGEAYELAEDPADGRWQSDPVVATEQPAPEPAAPAPPAQTQPAPPAVEQPQAPAEQAVTTDTTEPGV